MTMLSVNLNKVATLRNARNTDYPSMLQAARTCVDAGAGGITVHPRPDGRHTRFADVCSLAAFVRGQLGVEFNVEGNPVPDFIRLVLETHPTQCTLVPDAPEAMTSDHGWDLQADGRSLLPIIENLRGVGIRVSLFVNPEARQIDCAKELRADRIELYTGSYARAFGSGDLQSELGRFVEAAEEANRAGLGINAGHDLTLENVGLFCREVPGVLEVSIGHALVSRALEVGLAQAVKDYRGAIGNTQPNYA